MVDDGGISLDFLRKGKESLPKKDVTCSRSGPGTF